ncbi:RsaA secretion system, membrane protein RsaE [alpha proteobacterium BAL199]|jgi:HlyD family type I secretion membrane fusion protein|nr:RsaA secretion system, membrane protein RsaE [alpha proteobacterium BAL199]
MSIVEQQPASTPALVNIFDPYQEISKNARPHWASSITIGYLIVLVFFGGFGGFAAFAPLQSSVMATGELRVENSRKIVQHPEGGIVAEINVREGQRVEQGEVLLRLDPTRDRAQSNTLRRRYLGALAEQARLLAERDALESIDFPKEVLNELGDPEIAELVDGQRAVFRSRQASRDGLVKLMLSQVDQAKAQINATKVELSALQTQADLIAQELGSVRELYEKGLERLPRLLSLQRTQAAIRGQTGRLNGSIAQYEKQISEFEQRVVQMERDLQREVAVQLDAVGARLQDLNEQRPVISASVRRLDIRAPRTGRVIDLHVFTIGQVIGGREPLMQIVPEDEDLVVYVKVKPRDIDSLNNGVTKVQVRMTSFSQRFTHPIEGYLESISSDSVQDPDGSPPYYRAIIRLDATSREHILHDTALTAGMPAMAMIGVGEKTLLTYLIEPLSRSISDSLREP